jgi:hypothetical protein
MMRSNFGAKRHDTKNAVAPILFALYEIYLRCTVWLPFGLVEAAQDRAT